MIEEYALTKIKHDLDDVRGSVRRLKVFTCSVLHLAG